MNLLLFQKIIKDFQLRSLPSLTQRDLKLSFIKDMSLAIVGTRRGGKTYRTFQFIQDLVQQEVQKENFCRQKKLFTLFLTRFFELPAGRIISCTCWRTLCIEFF
jgi:GTPase SAR1 family protein